jgi:hypothetical protein
MTEKQKPQAGSVWGFCMLTDYAFYFILLTNLVNRDFWLEALFL